MIITNGINFDNTLQVKLSAKANEHYINNIPSGNEKQKYNIGDTVITIQHVIDILPNTKGKIIDIYNNNGYIRYIVQFERLKANCKRKTELIERNFRQNEITRA